MKIFKEKKDRDIYYLDLTKIAIIACFSVVGIYPELQLKRMKRQGNMITMSIVNNKIHIHEALCSLVLKDF